MNPELLQEIVNAVLYEGYVLYPYRPSSIKNCRERFTFGRVYPESYSVAQKGAEPFVMQTECLMRAAMDPAALNVSVGFLQPMAREVAVSKQSPNASPAAPESNLTIVPELRVGNELFQTWHEAVERRITLPSLVMSNGSPVGIKMPFSFPRSRELDPIRDGDRPVGMMIRRQEALEGDIEVEVAPLPEKLFKVTVKILNHTPCPGDESGDREGLLMRTLASTHTVLSVEGGEFISLMDPPSECREAADACRNIGTWPVLVGDESQGERDAMLSAPIILYDYPKIAPESAGPLFDGTEIDEILTLRILTMTAEEKLEMDRVDEHARRLLERTETLSEEALLRMHGTLRKPERGAAVEFDDFFGASTPLTGVHIGDVYLQAGDRVRLRPKARADVIDLALNGQTAVIEAVEQDLEKRIHLAVIIENDPGKDLGLLRQPGHRFFYGVDEVEPLEKEVR